MRTIILAGIVFTLSTSTAEAVFIGDFPGLDKLIQQSDAIVVLCIEERETPAQNPYGTYACRIIRTLKGDIPADEIIPLSLMDASGLGTMHADLNPFPYGSTHLLFLTKRDTPNIEAEYGHYTIQYVGANVRLSSLGDMKLLEGRTTQEQIRTLLTRTTEYDQREFKRKQNLLESMIDGDPESSTPGK